jgi:hypothetical protein
MPAALFIPCLPALFPLRFGPFRGVGGAVRVADSLEKPGRNGFGKKAETMLRH